MIKNYTIAVAMIFTNFASISLAASPNLPLADALREEGRTLEALDLYNQALVDFQQNHDYNGILAALSGRLISWQHLFNHEEDRVYAILARKEAEAILAIAQEHNIHDKDLLIHFLLGKSCIFLKDFKCAEMEFTQTVALCPQDSAEKGDLLTHLGEAIYKNGRPEEGERMILEGVQQIQTHQEGRDPFTMNVWISGAYIRLAKILMSDQKMEQANIYLSKAEEIILKNPKLVIRKQQLDILKKKIKQ